VRTTRGPEPLIACYRQAARGGIREAVETGDLKAASLGQRLQLRELTEQDVAAFGPVELLLANLNTPEDYAQVQ
jgi:molybdopterin-guanine dinucleotide biosynthesis protein A